MRILGLDPGTHRIGYGLIDAQGQKMTAETYGCLETQAGIFPGDRLVEIDQLLASLIHQYRPEVVAIEELYFVQNVTTGLRVAEARGVLVLGSRRAGLPIAEYKPNLIKSTVTGYGLASKQQVQKMVQMLLNLPTLPKPDDAADGLAIAMCHAVLSRGKIQNSHIEIRNDSKKILKSSVSDLSFRA